MKARPTVIVALAMVSLCVSALAEAPKRGEMKAVMIEKAPALDGVGRDGAWAKCPPMPLGECTTGKPGILKTTARVLVGPAKLYVSFDCVEPATGGIVSNTTERDGDVWSDDCVEVFVSGDIRRGMFHVIVNAKGVIFDSKGKDKSHNTKTEAKTKVHAGKGWTVTLAIPLADVGAYVGKNQTWVMNLNRTKPGDSGNQPAGEWSWAIMGSNDYHQVSDFGRLAGVTVPKRTDGVTRTATAPPAPPSFDKGVKAGSVLVYHRYGDVTLTSEAGALGKTLKCNLRNSPGLKLAFLATPTGDVKSLPLNMADKRANDNTTANGYRTFIDGKPLPVVYFVDRFRYNAVANSLVGRNTHYTNVRFHGRAPADASVKLQNVVLYRGEDTTPPAAPTGLKGSSAKAGVMLAWEPATDNVGVATYVIACAGKGGKGKGDNYEKIGESFGPSFTYRPKAGTCRYRVAAVDFQDNVGPWSKAVEVKNPLDNPQAELTGITADLVSDRKAYAERIRKVHAAGVGKVRKGYVMAFGDSLTYATSYRTSMEAYLGRYRVEAKGYPAKRTSYGLKMIPGDLEKVNPEFCFILLGTNNSKSARALPPAMEDLKAIVAACEKRGTVAIVGTIPPRGFRDPASKPEAGYNAELIKTCREAKIPVCYLFEYFQSLPDRKKLLAGDGVHWQGEGFPATSRAWKWALDQVNFALLQPKAE